MSCNVRRASEWSQFREKDGYGDFCEFTIGNGAKLALRRIPRGKFMMGSPEDEWGRLDDEGPRHQVTLTRGFWLGETQVTQLQWRAVMGTDPRSRFKGDTLPVEQVSWYNCQDFCRVLNEGFPRMKARLPTEAEWEYACRAGTTNAFNDGSECTVPEGKDPALAKLAWYQGHRCYKAGDRQTGHVRQLHANMWGLYDMHGNVWEWCADGPREYDSTPVTNPRGSRVSDRPDRAVRGGSWLDAAWACRSACRLNCPASLREDVIGFRIAAG